MMLGSTLWILLLIVLAWVVIHWLNHRANGFAQQTHTQLASSPTAAEILSQRYARGEIDATTFGQMRERLEASDNAHHKRWS
jgi:putative membrane protein